jgi:hypothetical protein
MGNTELEVKHYSAAAPKILSRIVPQQEEASKKEQVVVISGESKMLISDLCIELDQLETKTQMMLVCR